MLKAFTQSSIIIYITSKTYHTPAMAASLSSFHPSIRFIDPKSFAASVPAVDDTPPPGTVKSILPCTPLGVVKCLEYIGVYNKILPYGDRAYGKTVTVINRYTQPLLHVF